MAEWHHVTPNPDVLFSDLGEGGILFDLNTKQYFSLSPSAAMTWNYLDAGGSLADLEAGLVTQTPAGDAIDPYGLRSFAALLSQHKLAEAGRPAGAVPLPAVPAVWEHPRAEEHGNPLSEVILSPFDPTVPIPE